MAEVSAITVDNADQMARPFQPQTNATLREKLGKKPDDATGKDMARVAIWLIDKCGYTRHQACVQCNQAFGKPDGNSTIGSALSELTGRTNKRAKDGTRSRQTGVNRIDVDTAESVLRMALADYTEAVRAAAFEAGKAAAMEEITSAVLARR